MTAIAGAAAGAARTAGEIDFSTTTGGLTEEVPVAVGFVRVDKVFPKNRPHVPGDRERVMLGAVTLTSDHAVNLPDGMEQNSPGRFMTVGIFVLQT